MFLIVSSKKKRESTPNCDHFAGVRVSSSDLKTKFLKWNGVMHLLSHLSVRDRLKVGAVHADTISAKVNGRQTIEDEIKRVVSINNPANPRIILEMK